ncbi:hypothetical protein ABPG74_022758 [Tetrahymena malaccensis]
MENNQTQHIRVIGKNHLSKEDKRLLEIPEIEEDIKFLLEQAKKKSCCLILIGCILSKFGIVFCKKYSEIHLNEQTDEDIYSVITYFTISLFGQILVGFIIDLISLKVSWRFSQTIFLLGILFYITQIQIENDQLMMLSNYFFQFSFECNYVCGNYVIFNSQLFTIYNNSIPKIVLY